MQRTKRKRALKPITSSTKSSIASKSLDKENIVNQSTPKGSIRKEEELSEIFQSQVIRSIEKDELINGRYSLPRRSHESVSEFDIETLNRGMIYKPIARIMNVAKENRGDDVVVSTAASSTAVSESRPSEHDVFSSIGSAFEPNFPL